MIDTLNEDFGGRNVFLTGHTGFKGAWLALWLRQLDSRVTGYSLPPTTTPSLYDALRGGDPDGYHPLVDREIIADVRDTERLETALDQCDPSVVFHLAAQSLVRPGYREPADTFDINVLGTVRVLDAVRKRGKPCVVVIVTSDKCYEPNTGERALTEDDRLGGADPYSASKGAAEIVVDSYRRSFFPVSNLDDHGIAVATVRAGNVIGGGDWALDRIIPDTIRALATRSPVGVRNPLSVRPWQHVLDAASGYLTLASAMLRDPTEALCSAWNFGPAPDARAVNVGELVDLAIEHWGSGEREQVRPHEELPPETFMLLLDSSKARRELGWSERWEVDESIRRTIEWYRRFYSEPGAGMHEFSQQQIAEHEPARA